METNITLGKNGGYNICPVVTKLGSRSISVGGQADSEGVRQKFLRLDNFNSVSFKA